MKPRPAIWIQYMSNGLCFWCASVTINLRCFDEQVFALSILPVCRWTLVLVILHMMMLYRFAFTICSWIKYPRSQTCCATDRRDSQEPPSWTSLIVETGKASLFVLLLAVRKGKTVSLLLGFNSENKKMQLLYWQHWARHERCCSNTRDMRFPWAYQCLDLPKGSYCSRVFFF